MYLFYRYYSTGGTRRIPYFSALCAIVALIYIHVFQLLIVFNAVDLLPINSGDTRITKYGKFALLLLPIFLIFALLVKEKDLRTASYDLKKIKKANVYLVLYVIGAVVLLFALMIAFPKF